MAELFGKLLCERGIPTSRRNVFIRAVPIEVDLLVPRMGAEAEHGLVYDPADVQVVFEVKSYGNFGGTGLQKIRSCFSEIQKVKLDIHCAYVTLLERKTHKLRATEENLGFPAYTLFWHRGWENNIVYEATGNAC